MIKVTDQMLALLREYQMGAYGELDDDCDKRMIAALIELHEENKPKPEPVGYVLADDAESSALWLPDELSLSAKNSDRWKPLYTTPPTQVPLSGYKLADMWKISGESFIDFARAIERAHGIGVTNDRP